MVSNILSFKSTTNFRKKLILFLFLFEFKPF